MTTYSVKYAQKEAAWRLKRNLDHDVHLAMRRIRAYTATELREVELGLRESERERDRRELRESFQHVGRGMRQVAEALIEATKPIADAVQGVVDGFAEEQS